METELRQSDEPRESRNGSGDSADGSDSGSESSTSSLGVSGVFGIDNKQLTSLVEQSPEEVYSAGIISSKEASIGAHRSSLPDYSSRLFRYAFSRRLTVKVAFYGGPPLRKSPQRPLSGCHTGTASINPDALPHNSPCSCL